jgi:hypothetical protein
MKTLLLHRKRIKYVNLLEMLLMIIKTEPNNTNIVPIYHALNSSSTGEASLLDDFYGLMDITKGIPLRFFGGIDIAVGRMLVVVQKTGR